MTSVLATRTIRSLAATLAVIAVLAPAAHAKRPPLNQDGPTMKPTFLGMSAADLAAAYPDYFKVGQDGRVQPLAVPNIFRAGDVLNVGKVVMKVTDLGLLGNPYTNLTSDPSGQWPGQSGIEYLNAIAFSVGAVNPTASDPNAVRRVSYFREWRPKTLDPEDDIYPAYDGIINGIRFGNDDGDFDFYGNPKIDEDFLDGRDNDGDGKIDEDYAALGQKMYSCAIWDNTIEAINLAQAERHVPLGLEARQTAWAYSLSQYENFDVIQYDIYNRSGHTLDSVTVGFLVDMDCGPTDNSSYYADDLDLPFYPSGEFTLKLDQADPRRQIVHDPALYGQYPPGTSLCDHLKIRVNGFSIADDDGDQGRTPGVPSFLLFDHTIDPLGIHGPTRVGFRAFRSYTGGTPYVQGGGPTIDQQRFEFQTSTQNIDNDENSPTFGFINAPQGEQKGDYVALCSVGPWLDFANDAKISVTVGFAVQNGSNVLAKKYPSDYQRYLHGDITQDVLFSTYPSVKNAYDAQVAFEGIWERRAGFPVTTCHGCETSIEVPLTGTTQIVPPPPCNPDAGLSQVGPGTIGWFNFDCDYCTGIYDYPTRTGLFHKTWNASAPPPNPVLNCSVTYNYTDNPERKFAPAGDNAVYLAWDNLSEVSPDPSDRHEFDFRGYKVWKVADWTRPVGSPGPSESEWQLLGEFRLFDYRDINGNPIPNNSYLRYNPAHPATPDTVCPKFYIPQLLDSMEICLNRGDLWDRQSGRVLHPDQTVQCFNYPNCEVDSGCVLGIKPCLKQYRTRYQVGRYTYADHEVKNGFIYFYSVTAFDSTMENGTVSQLEGRRSAVEAEGVVPQAATKTGKSVWVVPNPYRANTQISERPSSWDLTPNATDPTGTHIDFFGLPPGKWTIKIYTVSGDLVQELHSDDAVNESLRSPISFPNGSTLPGYNRQQDTPNDGQARWNLISRNGQDIVSGIYMFTVESGQGTQRGKFVVIR